MKHRLGVTFVALLAVLVLLGSAASPTQAQDDEVILTLAVWQFAGELFTAEFFADFEAQHPNVKVVIEGTGANFDFPAIGAGIDEHLDGVQDYTAAADVLMISSHNMSVEATRAGYFLDLAPLTSIDLDLNEVDYFPVVWNGFQWDRGLWAIPFGADPILMIYNAEAFDTAGVAYPSEFWTLDDLVRAIEDLAEIDSDGNVVGSPILIPDPTTMDALLLSLAGERLYDDSVFPSAPRIAQPGLEALLTTWAQLNEDGYIGQDPTVAIEDIPMLVTRSVVLPQLASLGDQSSAANLPGGQSTLATVGFAVSAGTNFPEEAYALAKWLSAQPEVVQWLPGMLPARQSLLGQEGDTDAPFAIPDASPEQQALIMQAYQTALPFSELRYHEYLAEARVDVLENGSAPQVALRDAEVHAVENLRTAEERRGTETVYVATPVPTVTPSAGDITLNFGSQLSWNLLPTGESWLQALDDFAAQDPEVSQVTPTIRLDPFDLPTDADCFYLLDNGVPTLNLQTLLSLDPLINADPMFNADDVLPGVMTQLQRGGMTWGYPLSISPQVLRYHVERFAQVGAIPPGDGWTVADFVDALRLLRPTNEDPTPFVTFGTQDYLLLLITAFGGVPFDYSQIQPQVDLTSPANMEAIRQVLDLAKDGYIHYQPAGATGAGTIVDLDESAIYPDALGLRSATDQEDTTFQIAPFPTGSQHNAAMYAISSAYISATSPYPEACYRLITFLDSRTELIDEMPARFSHLNDPNVVASQGSDDVDFYNQYAAQLQQPGAVVYPSMDANSIESSLLMIWVGRAFDRYVLEDADLETELNEAQLLSTTYLECTVNIPAFDPARFTSANEYVGEFAECSVAVDPSLRPLFGGLLDDE